MKLNFLGRGAAFNPKEGNNSAFFIENDNLFLIDCGENIFERIIEQDLLNGINNIYLMITHTHSDHVGSIGTLVMYSYFKLGTSQECSLKIILPNDEFYKKHIEDLLNNVECLPYMYETIYEDEFDNKYKNFQNIRYLKTIHRDKMMAYGILFNTKNGIVYYSGDTKELTTIKAIISSGQPIDKLYIDATTANIQNDVHLNIYDLEKTIPDDLKNRVYCMHLNDDPNYEDIANNIGFNVVKVKKGKALKRINNS